MVAGFMLAGVAAGTVTFVVLLWFQGAWLAFFGAQLAATLAVLLVGGWVALRSRRDSTSAPGSDQRGDARLRTFRRGKLKWSDGQADCIIQDVSQNGARLTFPSTVHPPGLLHFYIAEQDRTTPVQVRWRTADEIGVEFLCDRVIAPDSETTHRTPELGAQKMAS